MKQGFFHSEQIKTRYRHICFITGLAELANIKSNPKGDENDRFQLEWVANSYSPVTTFKIEYKGKFQKIVSKLLLLPKIR